jgi:poly-gamma-glutamate synthesis protein (capsule biosynthesis protein)
VASAERVEHDGAVRERTAEDIRPPGVPFALPLNEALRGGKVRERSLTITLAGDTGLGGSTEPVHAEGGVRHGARHSWSALTQGIKALVTGDLNFANLETVVTDRNDLTAVDKAFNFRTHPAGVRHLTELGFNIFSTANNHAADYGDRGVRETIAQLATIESERRMKAHAGVGLDRRAAALPRVIEMNGARVLLSALGIGAGGNRAGDMRAGQLAWGSKDDLTEILRGLTGTDGDYRMLSVHYGTELSVLPSEADRSRLRDTALREAGVDLVVGHHAHVASGVERVDGKLVFYGLGNFLHLGTQDMSRFNLCRDYGLFARVHLGAGEDGRLAAEAIEVVPITGMHLKPEPMQTAEAAKRVHVLNQLARRFDDPAVRSHGVRFSVQADGSGLACFAGETATNAKASTLCRGWRGPDEASEDLRRQIRAACGGEAVASAPRTRVVTAREEERVTSSASVARRRVRTSSTPKAANSGGDFFAKLFGL